jgi:predicted fused transcriptional regulator/phosphomethylpyrimidine kinase
MRKIVYTQDQLDKQARLTGRVRVVPVGMRIEAHHRREAMPDHWFYSDKIKEISNTYDVTYDSGDHRRRMLKLVK